MGLKRKIISLCFILTIFVVAKGYSRPVEMPRIGRVTQATTHTLTVAFEDGNSQTITSSNTMKVVRSENGNSEDLNIGDHVRVMGFVENQSIQATVIIAGIMDTPKGPDQVRQRRNSNGYIGTITSKNPLSMQSDSGNTFSLETSPRTRIIIDYPMEMSAVTLGDRVRLLPNKMIVLPNLNNSNRPKERFTRKPDAQEFQNSTLSGSQPRNTQSNSSLYADARDTLRPSIKQQPFSPSFIYGAWIGRGLYSNAELDRAFYLAKNLGIRYLKVEFKWDYVEPSNNRWRWTNDDFLNVEHVISLARQYDFSIIPYFNTFMPWGQRRQVNPQNGDCEGPPSRRGQYLAPDPQEYAEYVFAVIDKLKRGGVRVEYAELDNEVSVMVDNVRSWNCFIDITPRQLKEAENMAYDQVKSRYPEIMISSTTFTSPGLVVGAPQNVLNKFTSRLNKFIKAYFMEYPKPKFDFLGVHEIFHGSGNPFTTANNQNKDGGYNFSSYYDTYDIWRNILDTYGYRNTPIFITESQINRRGLQDVELLQKVVLARTKASPNKIRGWVLSQLTGSKKFTEGKPGNEGQRDVGERRSRNGTSEMADMRAKNGQVGPHTFEVGISNLKDGYQLREGYHAFHTMMTTLARYTEYKKKVMGQLNTRQPWIEQFSDIDGNLLYVAFIPWNFNSQDNKTTVEFSVGANKEVRITSSDGLQSTLKSDGKGKLSLKISQHPTFVEVPMQVL